MSSSSSSSSTHLNIHIFDFEVENKNTPTFDADLQNKLKTQKSLMIYNENFNEYTKGNTTPGGGNGTYRQWRRDVDNQSNGKTVKAFEYNGPTVGGVNHNKNAINALGIPTGTANLSNTNENILLPLNTLNILLPQDNDSKNITNIFNDTSSHSRRFNNTDVEPPGTIDKDPLNSTNLTGGKLYSSFVVRALVNIYKYVVKHNITDIYITGFKYKDDTYGLGLGIFSEQPWTIRNKPIIDAYLSELIKKFTSKLKGKVCGFDPGSDPYQMTGYEQTLNQAITDGAARQPLDYQVPHPSTTNLVNGISTPVVVGTPVGTTVALVAPVAGTAVAGTTVASANPSLTQHIFIIYKLDQSASTIDSATIEKIYISFLNNGSNTYVANFEYDQTNGYTISDNKQICIGACTSVNVYVPVPVTAPAINPDIEKIKNVALVALKKIIEPTSTASGATQVTA